MNEDGVNQSIGLFDYVAAAMEGRGEMGEVFMAFYIVFFFNTVSHQVTRYKLGGHINLIN